MSFSFAFHHHLSNKKTTEAASFLTSLESNFREGNGMFVSRALILLMVFLVNSSLD